MAGGEPILSALFEHVSNGEFLNVQESEHLVHQLKVRVSRSVAGHFHCVHAHLQQLNELGVQLPFPRLRWIVVRLLSDLAVALALVL